MDSGHSNRVRQDGFSLTEILVAMLIAMIAMLAISSVLVSNDRFQRSTIGTSDAQTTGSLALYTIERDARMAGFGMVNSNVLGCSPIQYYYKAGGGNCGSACYSAPANDGSDPDNPPLPAMQFVPIVIEDGAAGAPDAITIAYANPTGRVIPGVLKETMPQPSSELKLEEVTGFNVNDLVVVYEAGAGCTLMQVTQVQAASAQMLQHNPGNSAPYNPVGGTSLFPAYNKGALVFSLGQPEVRRYDIANNQLRVVDYFTYASASSIPTFNSMAQILFEQIVDMQAQYGKDTNNDGQVDTWDNVTPAAGSTDWLQILAIRVGLLSRSKDFERQEGGVCTATTELPGWTAGNFAVPGGVPSCYKYRVFETTIPLRNMIWRES